MKNSKGFTLIELIIVIAIIAIIGSLVSSLGKDDATRFNECVEDTTFLPADEVKDYCLGKMAEEDRNTAIMLSED